jgi:hypothetical protein
MMIEEETVSDPAEKFIAAMAKSRCANFHFNVRTNKFHDDSSFIKGVSATRVNSWFGKNKWPRIVAPDGKSLIVSPSDYIKSEMRRFISGLIWAPGQPALVRNHINERDWPLLNTWKAPPPIEADWQGDISVYENFINALIPNDMHRAEILNRLALKIQKPEAMLRGTIFIVGAELCGKTTLFKPTFYFNGNSVSQWTWPYYYLSSGGSHSDIELFRWPITKQLGKAYGQLANENESYSSSPIETEQSEIKRLEFKHVDYYYPNRKALFVKAHHSRLGIIKRAAPNSMIVHVNDLYCSKIINIGEVRKWIESGGWRAVIYWLSRRDISEFDGYLAKGGK